MVALAVAVIYALIALRVWCYWDRALPEHFPLTYRDQGGRHSLLDLCFMGLVAVTPTGWLVTLADWLLDDRPTAPPRP